MLQFLRTMPNSPAARGAAIAGLSVAALAVGAVLYGSGSPGGNSGAAASCRAAAETARRIDPLIRGEIAALKPTPTSKPLPVLAFQAPDGRALALDAFRGRTLLVNLWATWCAPCRAEMPALDAMQAALGSADFEVVAVNIDTRNPDRPGRFLDEVGVRALIRYADPSAATFGALKAAGLAFGMPTSILVDPEGCEIASLAGPADWSSPEALEVVRAALRR